MDHSTSPQTASETMSFHSNNPMFSGSNHHYNDLHSQPSLHESDYNNYQNHNPNIRISMDDSMLENYGRDMGPYPSLKRVQSFSASNNKSWDDNDDTYGGDARMLRIKQAESAIRAERYKECTFHPEIKKLPSHYGPLKETGTQFIDRVTKWQKEKEQTMKVKEIIARKTEEDQCTFKPKINKNSVNAVLENRVPVTTLSPETANERLYRNSTTILENKQKLLEDVYAKIQEKEQKECTFKPDLMTKSTPYYHQAKPKYDRVFTQQASASNQLKSTPHYSDRECTFTPKVNKVKPNMSSAKMYLSSNVIERLSRPISADLAKMQAAKHINGMNDSINGQDDSMMRTFDTDNPALVMDAATFIGSLQQHQGSANNNNANKKSPGEKVLTKEQLREQQAKFSKFWERQQLVLKKRQSSIKQLEEHLKPDFKPQVQRSSSATRSQPEVTKKDFLVRVEMDKQRRLSNNQKLEVEADSQFSFKPAISKSAEQMRARSVFELSRGDALRREASLRTLQVETEQKKLEGVTLQPAISTKAKELAKSRLQLDQMDVSEYVAKIKELKEQKEVQRRNEIEKRQQQELESCTFEPRTTQCPAYIKRIANSVKVVKAARSMSQLDAPKQDWR